ncbi:MAG: superoxide dismutase [Lentisphaerae bacterium]|nr:superoxide dismutase [Lentisphaerota bacterium]
MGVYLGALLLSTISVWADTSAVPTLPPLPYPRDALAPHISAQTLDFHYGKHHQGYWNNLNRQIAGTPLAALTVEQIVLAVAGKPGQQGVFNNAAQVWNHTFFWSCMKPGGGGKPGGRLLAMIEARFGSFEVFRTAFRDAALEQFGSGWAWLVQVGDRVEIVKTANADTPLAHGQHPLLTCDVWEHAYYLDYQNRRQAFVEAFLDNLVNWDFVAGQLK